MEGRSSTGGESQGPTQGGPAQAKVAASKHDSAAVRLEAVSRFVKGGASGLLSGALLQPMQVIKTSMQVSPQDKAKYLTKTLETEFIPKNNHVMSLTARQATLLIYRREGFPGFMRGFTPSMLKNTLNAGSYFSMLYYTETLIRQTGLFKESQIAFMASAFARTIQTVISNPLIIVKTRAEVIGFEYNGLFNALRQIVVQEGGAGLFTGLKVSLIRDVPFSGIFYPIYNFFKTYFLVLFGLHNGTGGEGASRAFNITLVASLASFTANAVCCTITNPLDLIRTRVYFQHHNRDPTQHYTGISNAIVKIYETDGFTGYFRGLLPRIARKGLGSIIAWSFYEYLIDKEDALIFA